MLNDKKSEMTHCRRLVTFAYKCAA